MSIYAGLAATAIGCSTEIQPCSSVTGEGCRFTKVSGSILVTYGGVERT